jgi:hypothetical protein
VDLAAGESNQSYDEIENKIIELLKKGVYTSKSIVELLKIDWSTRRVTNFLKERKDVVTVNGNPLKFTHISRKIDKARDYELF